MEIKDMMLDDIQARRAEISERRSAINAELDTAEGEALDALETEVNALNEEERAMTERETAIMEAAEERKAQIEDVIKNGVEKQTFEERKTMENIEIRNTKEYIDAYANAIRKGDDNFTECRALLTENVSGTVPIPELAEEAVRTAWERDGLTALVRKTYLRGNLKIGFERSGDDAIVHTEGGNAIDPENLVLGIVELEPKSIKKVLQVSDEVLDMKSEEFLRYIYDELTYRIAKKAADTLLAKIEACGSVSTNDCPGVPVVTEATIGVGTIAKAIANLSDRAANPTIAMNKLTYAAFKAAQYANGYAVDPFEGCKVVFNSSIAAYSAASTGDTYAIVGDFYEGAQFNFPNGDEITFKFDDLTLKKQDLVEIMGREYVGIGVVADKAFAKIQK